MVGTFGYMAPEQFQGRAMPASDVYAIGATALSLLTGREPEDLPHRGLALDVAESLRGTRARPELVDLLSRMLEPDPDRRLVAIGPSLRWSGDRTVGRPPWEAARFGGGFSRQEARTFARQVRQEARAFARQVRREARERTKDARRQGWQKHEPGELPWPLVVLFTVGLTIAQIAVFVALRGVVPMVLLLLGLRPAALAVREAGKAAIGAIGWARTKVLSHNEAHRARFDDQIATTAPPKARVEIPADDQVAVDEAADIEAERLRRR